MLVNCRCTPFLSESNILGDSCCLLSKKEKQKALCYSFIKKESLCQPTNPVEKKYFKCGDMSQDCLARIEYLNSNIFLFSFDPV